MSSDISLHELLDLSIGTPDRSSVNFSALHTLLHAILGHLKIISGITRIKDLDQDYGSSAQTADLEQRSADTAELRSSDKMRSGVEVEVSKCMSLIQELLKETQGLKETQDTLEQEVKSLDGQLSQLNVSELVDRIRAIEQFCNQVKDLDSSSSDRALLETEEALMEVGRLDKQQVLEERMERLEADHTQIQHLRDLLSAMEERMAADQVSEQLHHLRTLVDSLTSDQGKVGEENTQLSGQNNELVDDLQGAITQLKAEVEKHSPSCHLMEEPSEKQSHIDLLFMTVKELSERKADKDLLETEMETKADRRDLESSRLEFDSTMEHLLGKISGLEKAMEEICSKMDCKLNRIELDHVRKQVDEQWTSLQKQQMLFTQTPAQDDAAGIRKQLLVPFHCLSCDRPVHMKTPGPMLVSLPCEPGLPSRRSARPYTVYHQDQVRQRCRGERIPEKADTTELGRSCGGSHTLTYSSRRCARPRQSRPVFTEAHTQEEEVDLIGLDGRVYKGRVFSRAVRVPESRLPTHSPEEDI